MSNVFSRCQSLMHYGDENVCILNAGKRSDRPAKYFREEKSDYKIVYSEFKCDGKKQRTTP